MSIRTNELQQIIAPQSEDSILLESAAAGTGQLTMTRAAEFFDQELLKPGTQLSTSLSQKAEAVPPQRYSLLLPDGYTGELFYFRTQENIVFLWGYFTKEEGTIAPWTTITTVPEGILPHYSFPVGIGVASNSQIGVLGNITISYARDTHALYLGGKVPDGTRGVSFPPICYIAR